MTIEFIPFRCAECGAIVELKTGSGRLYEQRPGQKSSIPNDFEVPTCLNCGEQYFDVKRGEALNAVLQR